MREVAHARGTGFGFTDSPQEVEAGTLEALRSSIVTLAAKAPDEVDAYRELVLGTATHVSPRRRAASREDETATIAKLEDALSGGA